MDGDTAGSDAFRAALLADYDDALAVGGVFSSAQSSGVPPEFQAQFDEDLACLHLLQQLRPRRPEQAGATDACCTSPNACSAAHDDRYEVVSLHAAGGIGRVWLVRDSTLGRTVALKDLHPDKSRQGTLRARFLREAQITGQLQHPGIAPVYELVSRAGTVPGEPSADFYTMRLIRGQTLAQAARNYHARHTARKATAVERIALLNAFVSACHTVAYAHDRGVIHRDLKGANVVLGDFGEVVVLDWGFAKVLDHWDGPPLGDDAAENLDPVVCLSGDAMASHPSLPGQVMGTPAYMSPEQASGMIEEIDERTDVFGLGAILFEVLTGRPPFVGSDAGEVLRKVRTEAPPRPNDVRMGVPRSLQAICMKAMAHERRERYATVAELAREVQHWLADEPVRAYREPWTAKLGRWSRRHQPTVVGSGALIVSGLIAIAVCINMIGEERARVSRDQAEADARSRSELAASNYFQRIALAEREIDAGNISRAIQYLSDCPTDRRGWEWHCLQRLCRTNQLILRGHSAAVASVAFSPDGRLLASASHDRTIQIRDAANGSLLRIIPAHDDAVYALAFSPDGCRLASAGWDKMIKLWDPDTGAPLMSLGPQEKEVYRLAMSPDGRYLASTTVAATLRIWDLQSGQSVVERNEPQSFFGLAFSRTEPGVIATSNYRTIRIWNYHTGADIATLSGHHSFIKSLVFSPDGTLLASGTGDLLRGDSGEVRLWDVRTGQCLFAMAHTDPIYALAFAPNGRYLASASQDKTVKLWDVQTGKEALTLRGHTDTVRSVAFSPQGQRLATASADSTIRIWDAAPWSEDSSTADVRTLAHGSDRTAGAVFSVDGRTIASAAAGPALKIWNAASGAERLSVPMATPICALTVSPDGKYLVAGDPEGVVRLMDADTGRLCVEHIARDLGPVQGVAFSPDSRRFAACGWWRVVKIWSVDGKEPVVTLAQHSQPVLSVAFDPKGRYFASAGYDQTIMIWDGRNRQPVRTLTGHDTRIHGLAFSPDGRSLVSASHDGTIKLWDTASWQNQRTLHGHAAGVRAVAFSPDGTRLASASDDWSVRVWSAATGEELRTLRGHGDRVHSIAYSPDGSRLASVSYDGTIKLWEVGAD
jgi:WD40 repeat protein/serine/threonine protein kinase